MVSSFSSDATRKRVVFTFDDKWEACEMVRRKCHKNQNLDKGDVREA